MLNTVLVVDKLASVETKNKTKKGHNCSCATHHSHGRLWFGISQHGLNRLVDARAMQSHCSVRVVAFRLQWCLPFAKLCYQCSKC
jgi:hypothetical protein